MTIRIVVADDQPVVRAGIAMLLEAQPDMQVVAQAGDGSEAVDLARQHHPDVVVMDLRMPGVSGIDATRQIAQQVAVSGAPRPSVLVLTTFDDAVAVHDALRVGAQGFLLKQAAPQELPAAVRSIARGQAWIDPAVGAVVLDALRDAPAPGPTSSDLGHRLTPREREVLVHVARGLSNDDIKTRLVLSEATVKTHVAHILAKTGARDRAHLVALAHTTGFLRSQTGR